MTMTHGASKQLQYFTIWGQFGKFNWSIHGYWKKWL